MTMLRAKWCCFMAIGLGGIIGTLLTRVVGPLPAYLASAALSLSSMVVLWRIDDRERWVRFHEGR